METKHSKGPVITQACVTELMDKRFIRLFDLQYAPGKHYYNATRRRAEDLIAIKSEAEAKAMLPDAVSCVVVVSCPGEEPRLLLSMEYRYPAGRFLLSVPAGLIDQADKESESPLVSAACRELREETGLTVGEGDQVTVINPCMYSTPGMTDECNALVGICVHPKDLSSLTQAGAEGSECFDGFVLLTKDQARELLMSGRDAQGNFYSVYTFAALCWFVAGF